MQPPADFCWQCKQNTAAIMRSANSYEDEKSSTIDSALEYLQIVKQEKKQKKNVYTRWM